MTDTATPQQSAGVQYVVMEGEVQLQARLEGLEACTEVTFDIHRASDGGLVDSVPGELARDGVTATAAWRPELDPEGDARGLRVYYVARADDLEVTSPELEVYLDWVEVTSLDPDGNPLPDCGYTLTIGRFERHGHTGLDGTFREVGLPPGDVEVEWNGDSDAALVLVEWLDETGPTRKAKLQRVPRVTFVWPSPEGDGGRRFWLGDGGELHLQDRFHAHQQLTNLDADPAHPERGARLTCRVGFWPASTGKAGDKIYVKAEWPPADRLSKRNAPARALVGGADKPWASGANAKGLELTLQAEGGEATFEVDLGLAGGDQVTLSIGSTDRCEDARLVVSNWRTVYYQPTLRRGLTLPDLSQAEGWFADGAVTLEADGAAVQVDAGPPASGVDGKGGLTFVPAEWYWDGSTPPDRPTHQIMLVGHHNWNHFEQDVFLERKGALGVNLVLCDRVCHGTNHLHAPYVQSFANVELPGPDLTQMVDVPDPAMRLFARAVHDGSFPVVNVRWTGPTDASVPAELRNKSGTVPEAWIEVPSVGGSYYFIVFPAPDDTGVTEAERLPGRILAAGGTLKVRGQVYVADAGFAGWARGKQVALAKDEGDDAVMNYLVAHEVGHKMHQAAANNSPSQGWEAAYYLPPGFAFSDHPRGYQGHNHVGGHCNFGVPDAKVSEPDYTTLAADEQGTCAMFGMVLSDMSRLIGFCEHCLKFTRGYDMKSVH